jgi:hypothetical protein
MSPLAIRRTRKDASALDAWSRWRRGGMKISGRNRVQKLAILTVSALAVFGLGSESASADDYTYCYAVDNQQSRVFLSVFPSPADNRESERFARFLNDPQASPPNCVGGFAQDAAFQSLFSALQFFSEQYEITDVHFTRDRKELQTLLR